MTISLFANSVEIKMAASGSDEAVDLLTFVEDSGGGGTALWDPDLSNDWDKEKPTNQCILRIKRYSILFSPLSKSV